MQSLRSILLVILCSASLAAQDYTGEVYSTSTSDISADWQMHLSVDSSNAIWCAGFLSGLDIFSNGAWSHRLDTQQVYSIATAPNGDVWYATADSLYVDRSGATVAIAHAYGEIHQIAIDEIGNVWIAAPTDPEIGQLVVFDGQNWIERNVLEGAAPMPWNVLEIVSGSEHGITAFTF